MLIPILLLAVLLVIVVGANAMRNKGSMSASAYQTLVSVTSIIVTIAALVVLFRRLRA